MSSPVEWLGRRVRRLAPWSTDGDACREGRRTPEETACTDAACESVRLTQLPAGVAATITCLEDAGSLESRKLAAMGLLPGVSLRVLQRTPAWVLRIGYSDVALDRELADRIRVRTGATAVSD